MEYVKEGCTEQGEMCEKCKDGCWVGPRFSRIPAPFPDPQNPGHYMNVFKTPTLNDKKMRQVDDFAPRANIKKTF